MNVASSTSQASEKHLEQEVYALEQARNEYAMALLSRLEDSEACLKHLEHEHYKLAKKIRSSKNAPLNRIVKIVSTLALVLLLSFGLTALCSTVLNGKLIDESTGFLNYFIPKYIQKLVF